MSPILTDLSNHKKDLASYGVKKIGLFGSYVRGEAVSSSDIDLLVEFKTGKKSYRNLLGFAQEAENILQRRVEAVTPESLSPFILPHVMEEIQYVEIS